MKLHPAIRIALTSLGALVAITFALICTIIGTNLFALRDLRESTLQTAEANLARYSLTLAENADRSFKSLDLVLSSFGLLVMYRIAPA